MAGAVEAPVFRGEALAACGDLNRLENQWSASRPRADGTKIPLNKVLNDEQRTRPARPVLLPGASRLERVCGWRGGTAGSLSRAPDLARACGRCNATS